MGAHSAPIHSLRCSPAAEAFFPFFSTKKEGESEAGGEERGRGGVVEERRS